MARLDADRLRYYEETIPYSHNLGSRTHKVLQEMIEEVRASWEERDEFREGNDHWIAMHDAEAKRRNEAERERTEACEQLTALLTASEEALYRVDTQGGAQIRLVLVPLREAVAAARTWEEERDGAI